MTVRWRCRCSSTGFRAAGTDLGRTSRVSLYQAATQKMKPATNGGRGLSDAGYRLRDGSGFAKAIETAAILFCQCGGGFLGGGGFAATGLGAAGRGAGGRAAAGCGGAGGRAAAGCGGAGGRTAGGCGDGGGFTTAVRGAGGGFTTAALGAVTVASGFGCTFVGLFVDVGGVPGFVAGGALLMGGF